MRFRAPVPADAPAVLAVLEARERADLGEVEYALGDLTGCRSRAPRPGLGTAMLQSTFAAFADAGLREARLGVASYNARGIRVYERVGMAARYRFDVYERQE